MPDRLSICQFNDGTFQIRSGGESRGFMTLPAAVAYMFELEPEALERTPSYAGVRDEDRKILETVRRGISYRDYMVTELEYNIMFLRCLERLSC